MKYTNYVISFYLVFNITLVSIKSLRVQKLWGREVFSSDFKNTFKDFWRKLRNLHRIFDHGLYCVLIRSNSWFSLVSNVGKDVELFGHVCKFEDVKVCPVWSEFGRREAGIGSAAQFAFTGVQRQSYAARAKIHKYFSCKLWWLSW